MVGVATPAEASYLTSKRYNSPDSVWASARTKGVWIVGDSITVADYPDLVRAFLANGKPVAVDATAGIPTRPALDRLYQRVHKTGFPATIVVALGTNDACTDPEGIATEVDRLTKFVPPTTKIVWVNTWAFRRWSYGPDKAGTAEVNRLISEQAARHRNVTVVDWHSFAGKDPHHYLRDGVHTNTGAGRAARNGIVFRAVMGVQRRG